MSKKLFAVYLFFLLLAFGCGKEEVRTETVSLEEWAGKLGEEVVDSSRNRFTIPLKENATNYDKLVATMLPVYDTFPSQEFHFLDRFIRKKEAKTKMKFSSKKVVSIDSLNRVHPETDLLYYHFSDSTVKNNAFYNWLDCFGKNCTPVQLGQNINLNTEDMLSVWVLNTSIVVLQRSCAFSNQDWKPFSDSVTNYLGENYNFRLELNCNGELNWLESITEIN